MGEFFYSEFEVDIERVRTCTKNICSPVVAEIIGTYEKNMELVLTLLALPLTLLAVGAAESHRLAFFAQAMVSTGNVDKWHKSEEAKKEVAEEVDRLFQEFDRKGGSGSSIIDDAKLRLEKMSSLPQIENSLRALVFSGISISWAAFESLAKDLWIAALNTRPRELAQTAFSRLPDSADQNELTRKYVPVGVLARYGFDVRDKLGTILEARFDFTSYSGIRTAYSSAFGNDGELPIIFGNSSPGTLEAMRHLVVHRAGYVDEEYTRRTGQKFPMGSILQVPGRQFSELIKATAKVSCDLALHVDGFLAKVATDPQP